MKQIIQNTDLAYAAGYIDGDGCFYIGKTTNKKTNRTRYQYMIIVSSTNRDVLEYFKNIYGGSVRLSNSRNKYPGQKPQYQYIIKGKNSLSLSQQIFPYLVEKVYQAEQFIKFIEIPIAEVRNNIINFMRSLKNEFHLVSEQRKSIILEESNRYIPTEEDYAYLAGFIDAECCLAIHHYKPKNKPNDVFKIAISCNNTKWLPFEWLIQRFGGHLCFVDRKSKNINHHDQFQWKLTGKALSNILPHIYKYLIYKKPICEQLIKFYETTLKNGGARHTEKFRESYAKTIEIRNQIVHEVHRLNKKGI